MVYAASKAFKVDGQESYRLTAGNVINGQFVGDISSANIGAITAKMTYKNHPNLGVQGDYIIDYPNGSKTVLNFRNSFKNQIYAPGSYFLDTQGIKYFFEDVPSPVTKVKAGYSDDVTLFTETATITDKNGGRLNLDINAGELTAAGAENHAGDGGGWG